MTSIPLDIVASPPAPLPIGALAVGVQNLLQEAADLPAPCLVSIFDTQHISVQFDGADPSSMRAITRWARRFGGTVTSQPYQGKHGPETWHSTEFAYNGVPVRAYTHIKAAHAAT